MRAVGDETCRADWLRDRRVLWLWLAAFAVAGAGWLLIPGTWGALLAAGGFAVAGALCVANAMHCRRLHCVATGPVYLAAAALFLARAGGWDVPGRMIVAGAVAGTVLAFVPEWLGLRYIGGDDRSRV